MSGPATVTECEHFDEIFITGCTGSCQWQLPVQPGTKIPSKGRCRFRGVLFRVGIIHGHRIRAQSLDTDVQRPFYSVATVLLLLRMKRTTMATLNKKGVAYRYQATVDSSHFMLSVAGIILRDRLKTLGDQCAPCQIRKIVGCACTENAGNVFPAIDF